MRRTTVGQLLIDSALPEDMRGRNRVLDKAGMGKLLQELAERHPDRYGQVVFDLVRVGKQVAYFTGGNSFGLDHLSKSLSGKAAQLRLREQVEQIYASDLSDDAKEKKVVDLLMLEGGPLQDAIYNESLAEHNPFATQVLSGARGNKTNLRSLRGGDLLYVDHHDRPIPVPILHSYSEGLSPVEYFAGAFGARKGVVDTKSCLLGATRVLMADYSEKEIRNVQPGDMVMGSDRQGRMCPVRVVRVFKNGLRECWRYRFRKGSTTKDGSFRELVATEDHKVLAEVRAGRPGSTYAYRSVYEPAPLPLRLARIQTNPTKNEFVAYPSRGEYDRQDGMNEPRALLAGLMIGDGCMAPSVHGSYTFSCADQRLLDDVKDYLATFNLRLSKQVVDPKNYSYSLAEAVRSARPCAVVAGRNSFVSGHINPTKDWLRATLGDKLAHQKKLPDVVWTWDDRSVGDLLGGIFSTDGCVHIRKNGCTIKLVMTAKKVVVAVQRLLELRFGIWSGSFRRIDKRTKKNAKHDQYEISISHPEAVRRFADRVSLVGKKKEQLQQGLLCLSAVPRSEELGFKIYSKEYVGRRMTYDLEVDHPDHLFVLANGLVVSNSTQDAGYFSKQLSQASHRLVVTANDYDDDGQPDFPIGLPTTVDDPDNEGALLSVPAGGYPRNTILTPQVLADLKAKGVDHLLVRSPIAGGPPDGGVYARDLGIREKGVLPPVGDYVGLTAAQALGEPLSQAQLSSKHSGGVAGAAKGVSGFKLIDQLAQVPKTFKGGAAHAQLDGEVTAVRPAPQGGHYVTVGGQDHYVATGFDLKVKPGDLVEAGDVLSDGVPNPAEIVRHKGVGEGKRYFVDTFRQAYKDAGIQAHRRNVELVARGLINHVRIRDETDDYLPDDVVPYSRLERNYRPREGYTLAEPHRALDMYLERPVLHYSIGTRVRPSVVRRLQDFGINSVAVHREAPPFEPEMIRSMENLTHDPDWMTRFLGSYLQKNLLKGVHRGDTADELGTSYVPALARGENFGRQGPTQGYDQHDVELARRRTARQKQTETVSVPVRDASKAGRPSVMDGIF